MNNSTIDTSCYYQHKETYEFVVIVRFIDDSTLEIESRSFGAQPAWDISKERFLAEYVRVDK